MSRTEDNLRAYYRDLPDLGEAEHRLLTSLVFDGSAHRDGTRRVRVSAALLCVLTIAALAVAITTLRDGNAGSAHEATKPAIASSGSPLAPSSATGSRAVYLGPVTAASTLDGGDDHLDVPPAGEVAAVSPQTAFGVCGNGGGGGVCISSSNATIRLALVTTTDAGTAGPDGAINPLINNALTYVIEWTGVPCNFSGGPPLRPGATQTPLTPTACQLVEFVSADTGSYLYAFQSRG